MAQSIWKTGRHRSEARRPRHDSVHLGHDRRTQGRDAQPSQPVVQLPRSSIKSFDVGTGEMRLCWLPLSHIYARTSDYYLWVAAGGELALSESRDTILADLQVFKPHYLNGVPYFFDKVMRGLQEKGLADKPGILAGMLGGRMKLCCAGGTALPDYVAAFFESSGITLVQGYGLTESSPVITTGTLHEHRLGTVGKPIHGVEVKIADDGEILTQGPARNGRVPEPAGRNGADHRRRLAAHG